MKNVFHSIYIVSSGEILQLYRKFMMFTENHKSLTKSIISSIILTNPITPCIIATMFGNKNRISFSHFVQYLEIFRAPNQSEIFRNEIDRTILKAQCNL